MRGQIRRFKGDKQTKVQDVEGDPPYKARVHLTNQRLLHCLSNIKHRLMTLFAATY